MNKTLLLLLVACGHQTPGFSFDAGTKFIAADVGLVLCLQSETLGDAGWQMLVRSQTILVTSAGDTSPERDDYSIRLTVHEGANTEDTPFTHELLHVYAFTHGYADGDYDHTADFWMTDISVVSAMYQHRRHPEYADGVDFTDAPPHTGAFADPIYVSGCFKTPRIQNPEIPLAPQRQGSCSATCDDHPSNVSESAPI